MILVALAIIGLIGWLLLIRWLNGGDFRHKDLPPSWGDGGRGDDWYTRGPGR